MVQDKISDTPLEHPDLLKEWTPIRDYLIQNVIGDISKGVTTRRSLNKVCNFMNFVLQIEPAGIDKAIIDEHWSLAMQEYLN